VDALALESQQRAARAIAEGRFAKSVVPVYNEDGTLALDHEEFPRPQTTMESLAGLKPASHVHGRSRSTTKAPPSAS
jgi:acetyl-CoA C-acetyltransferase